ncbi:MAG: nuclease-related domain-containing protein [Sulfuricurvum sp.]|uniref:nuclease-related domain-containing protein n=1 Tax=Sulfuricurvum sp. TaxID=2025608 RepID=UPI00262FDA44|nr:nuclease-related domain-containing protein [Sulfuricurvum sp.]MDD5160063.1 nuclease-related domain-containing protein [Sulfuricurvum sp.]
MNNKKSPLKDKPLRNAGQSLDEEITRIIDEDATPYISASLTLILFAVFEWYRLYTHVSPSPWIFTIMALLFTEYSAYKIINIRSRLKNLRLGRDGEKAVGQYLESFRSANGIKVFHDIKGENFNIDHVVVSTKGIYIIETKTHSKPIKGKAEILFDGKKLLFNGADYGDRIMIQVKAENKWLSELIEELTARKFPIQPVIAFPGWFVKMTNTNDSGIWALNPRGLPSFLNNQQEVMSLEDVQLVSNHLSRYIRSLEA